MRTLLAAVVLLGSLAACGGDETDNASGTPTLTVTTTAATPTPSATPEPVVVDTAKFAASLSDGFKNLTTAHLVMVIDASGASISAEGDVDYSQASPAMALKMQSDAFGDGAIDMRLVNKVMYMSLPIEGAGDKFYKIDLSDPNNPLGASMGNLSSFDPKATFDMFSKGLQKVVKVGEEDIDGETATHYLVTTSTAEMRKTLPKALLKDFPNKLTYDVWLDADSRMRRMSAQMPGAGHLLMEMSQWGEPVTIVAPPKRKVQSFPSQ